MQHHFRIIHNRKSTCNKAFENFPTFKCSTIIVEVRLKRFSLVLSSRLLDQVIQENNFSGCVASRPLNILVSPYRLPLRVSPDLFPRYFPANFCMLFLPFHSNSMSHSSKPPWFYFPNRARGLI